MTQKRINQIIKEELNRALSERGMNEMTDDDYNEYIQQQHGRFTTPENIRGTPEYSARLAAGRPPMTPAAAPPYRSEHPAHHHYQRQFDELDGYIATGRLPMREADDDMDMDADTGIDVVPDDEMGGEEDMEMGAADMTAPLEQEIDWAQFEDEDGEAVGAAFLDAVKQLQEENPDESPTAEAVVALMQELLAGDTEEDMDDMGGEEMEDESPMEDAEEEGALNEWVRRTNLLAGTSKRR